MPFSDAFPDASRSVSRTFHVNESRPVSKYKIVSTFISGKRFGNYKLLPKKISKLIVDSGKISRYVADIFTINLYYTPDEPL